MSPPPRSMSLALALAAPVPTPACAGAETEQRTGVVLSVADGDTLALGDGTRVRLVQIDAPERGECYGGRARAALVALAPPGSEVGLEGDRRLDDEDRFARKLRYVFAAGRNVNVELVRRGAATPWFFGGERGQHARKLLDAVAAAQAELRGMWRACRVTWKADAGVEATSR